MIDKFKNIKAVGFDLDGTLYKTTPEINERISSLIAVKILEKRPDFGSLEVARDFYTKKYRELESGTKTLIEVGYGPIEAGRIMKECLERGDISDLLSEDKELVDTLDRIKEKYFSYLITKSPRGIALKKLKSLGIEGEEFDFVTYGDDSYFIGKPKTVALKKVFEESSIPPEEHVYVGDRRVADIIEPKALGMKTIAVWNKIPEADISIESINDIREILL